MFKHKIAQHTSILDSKTFPGDSLPPGIPENFSCQTDISTQGVTLTWDKPSSGGPVFYYEVFLNDTFLANESSTTYHYSAAVNGDVFKVRSVGVRGEVSDFSNTCTYSGDELLAPTAVGIPERTSVHIMWDDISSSDQISFEGYNVYLDGVKANTSLLPAVVNGYAFFDKVVDQEYTLGVSFVYDGGQESGIFEAKATPPGQGIRYQVSVTKPGLELPMIYLGDSVRELRIGGDFGIAVKKGTTFTIIYDYDYLVQHQERDWATASPMTFEFAATDSGSARMEFIEGCGNGLTPVYDRLKSLFAVNIDNYPFIYLGIYPSVNYNFVGPACNAEDNLELSATVLVNESDVNDVAIYDDYGGSFIKLPEDNDTLIVWDDGDPTEVTLVWSTFPSTPYYDLFIRTKGGSFPSTANYPNLTAARNYYKIDDLTPDVYEAQVKFKYGDLSVAESSNICEFEITASE